MWALKLQAPYLYYFTTNILMKVPFFLKIQHDKKNILIDLEQRY